MKEILKESLSGWRPKHHVNGLFYIMLSLSILFGPLLLGGESSLWSKPIKTPFSLFTVGMITISSFVVLDYIYSFILGFLSYFDKKRA